MTNSDIDALCERLRIAFDTDSAVEKNLALRAGHDAILALRDQLAKAEVALRKAEVTFRSYEQMHLAKGTPDGDEKAYRNKEMADKMRAAQEQTP